ncbi:hypothetical protein PO820_003723 [Cronobacter sakazakii]|nr:hypothetical protein [Cronobacter sakazakii]EKK7733397.1 hypothetical protein [Cronobacter sakazakii]EKM0378170.1 hypothetical protein [Cronobacter turicensis]ELY4123857.1 hypothetical protein [Cronobacter sakazakii]
MADWFIATEGVKVVKDSASLWPQIITAVSSIGAAMGGVALTHRFTLKREEAAAKEELASERLFIATELIIILEQYAEECAAVAGDDGEPIFEPNQQVERAPIAGYPVPLNFETVTGDWRSLPALLMFRIRELPLLRVEAMRAIDVALECDFSRDYRYFFRERQFRFARMGLKAIHLARQLRRDCRLPHSRLNESTWSAQPVMLNVLRRERKLRYKEAKEYDLLIRSY